MDDRIKARMEAEIELTIKARLTKLIEVLEENFDVRREAKKDELMVKAAQAVDKELELIHNALLEKAEKEIMVILKEWEDAYQRNIAKEAEKIIFDELPSIRSRIEEEYREEYGD
jgi:hypothetical protein